MILLGFGSGLGAQQRALVPDTVVLNGRREILRLEAFLYKPAGAGAFPLVVFSHGSALDADPKESWPSTSLANYFVSRGFAVLVFMRRGRGASDGTSLESEERNCDPESWLPGLESALEDVTAAVDYGRALPYVDASRVVLAGVSRGGFLSVAYAARGRRRGAITAVINLVGAWVAQKEDRCPRDFNELSLARYGRETRVPMLWLYGDHDALNDTPSIESYARRFRAGGGRLEFHLIGNVPNGGHALPEYPSLWRAHADSFLQRLTHGRGPPNER